MGSNLMRTATFGDRQVIRTLQQEYVLLWHNQQPGLNATGEQAAPTAAQAKAYPEGAGGTNVITFVADSSGKVAYKLTGYWRPEAYLRELKFGRQVAAAVTDASPEKTAEVLGAEHKTRLAAIAERRAELAKKFPEEFQKPVRESEVRKEDAALGLLVQSLTDSAAVAGKQSVKEVCLTRPRLEVIS